MEMKEDLGDFIEASGLFEYDPDLIARIYQKNPKRLFLSSVVPTHAACKWPAKRLRRRLTLATLPGI